MHPSQPTSHRSHTCTQLAFLSLAFSLPLDSSGGENAASAVATTESIGVSGGLCVQIGAEDTGFAADLARTGRFLVHVLAQDADAVDDTRRRLSTKGVYGLISVDRFRERPP